MKAVIWWVNLVFFFNDTATTEIYTLSLHDALPISRARRDALPRDHHVRRGRSARAARARGARGPERGLARRRRTRADNRRSEEHTSELQSRQYLVCRLFLLKKKHT